MVRSIITRYPALVGYSLVGIMWLLALIAWAQNTPSAFTQPSAYDIFPLFGLMGFSALLTTYVVNALSTYLKISSDKLSSFYQTMGYTVLILIVSHPTALLVRLFMDGYGLPPFSYASYVNPDYVWVVWLGTISLFVFLAFELRRWFSRKGWWKWVVYANDVAMLLVLYHGLTLGTELRKSWLKYIWWLYAVVLIVALVYLRFIAKRKRH